MIKPKFQKIQKYCVLFGAILLAWAIILLFVWQWNIHASEKRAKEYVDLLTELIPEPQNAVPEERRNNTMSTLSVKGTDFVGIIELPGYGSALPVCANWGKTSKFPCRFDGSIYDGTLKIGATSQKGQYDFFRELSLSDTVLFTDMEGNLFTFVITSLKYEKHADQDTLQKEESALTLFIKNEYAFDYLIIYCDVLS